MKTPEFYLSMAEAAQNQHKFNTALDWIDQGLKQCVDSQVLLFEKAYLLFDAFEDIDQALAVLKIIETKSKHDSDKKILFDAYILLCDCWRLKDDYQQAYFYANQAISLNSKDKKAQLSLATANFELGNYSQALDLIKNIKHKDFYYLQGQILSAQGDFTRADKAFSKSGRVIVRLEEEEFLQNFYQAITSLPGEIGDILSKASLQIHDVVPWEIISSNRGKLAPSALMFIDSQADIIFIFKKNIENLAVDKTAICDIIASSLLHQLGKLL